MRVTLRILKEDDVSDAYVSWMNNPKVTKYLYTKSATKESLREYVKEKRLDPACFLYGIFLNKQHVGNVKLEIKDKKANMGIVISPDFWGQGIATEVIHQVIEIARRKKLDAVELSFDPKNKKAKHVYKKCGFQESKIYMTYTLSKV